MAETNPLIRTLGLQQIMQRDAVAPPETMDLEVRPESVLSSHVRKAWADAKLARAKIDLKLLECLRARRGVYSPAALAQLQAANGGMNVVWADITEAKCRGASAWIREIVLPTGEQPWGLTATPLPDLPHAMKVAVVKKAMAQAQQTMVQAAQAGGEVMAQDEFLQLTRELGDKLRAEAEKDYRKQAGVRAKRMEQVIADRMAQGGYAEAMDAFIEDFVTYPAAILKGPVYARKRELQWGAGWTPKVTNNPRPTWSCVSPFDAYPAPGARCPQRGDFIERVRYRRNELHDLKGLPNYRDDQIDAALRDYSAGRMEGWLFTESERQRLTQESLFMWLSPAGVIDALNYWGSVPGWKLMSWGVAEDLEETRDYECNVLLCGTYILYAALNPNPLGARPYRKACYDEIPGAFWGRSIPDLAATSQQMCNATLSSLADNLSVASGPQVWVHADRFADGEQSMELFPWKIWQLKSDPTQGTNPGIGFFQPDDRSTTLLGVYEKFKNEADDTTGIPRYTYGNEQVGGAGNTLGGLSILMNNAAKGLRRAISNIDLNAIGPTVNDAFVNEMVYNHDETIKGDCVVMPRGAAAILVRESAQQRMIQFLGMTANPVDAQIIGAKYRAALLRETAATLQLPIDDVVPSDEELAAQMEQQAQAAQAQAQAAQQAQAMDIEGKKALEEVKAQADMQREEHKQNLALIADVVKQSVAQAVAENKPAKDGSRKPINFKYDAEGRIVGAE